jgi:phosphohistidine phosphatase SixA
LRFLSIVLLTLTVGFTAWRPATAAQEDSPESVFFLVRHAEKMDDSEDPPLSEVGLARAQTLASLLVDAGIQKVYSSDFKRTRDTAAPLVEKLDIEVILYDLNNLPEAARRLRSTPGRYLVVGHSNTTPDMVRWLGGEPGPDIADDEYDRLYVLVHRAGGTTTTLLRFEAR